MFLIALVSNLNNSIKEFLDRMFLLFELMLLLKIQTPQKNGISSEFGIHCKHLFGGLNLN